MEVDLLEQIERELKALPEINVSYIDGPAWYGVSGTVEGGEREGNEEVPFSFGEFEGSGDWVDGFTPAYFRLLAHAPAYIEAMLPVVKAALVEYEADERYCAIHAEWTEEKGLDDEWLEDWMRRDDEALNAYMSAGVAKNAAVRAFKEAKG